VFHIAVNSELTLTMRQPDQDSNHQLSTLGEGKRAQGDSLDTNSLTAFDFLPR